MAAMAVDDASRGIPILRLFYCAFGSCFLFCEYDKLHGILQITKNGKTVFTLDTVILPAGGNV